MSWHVEERDHARVITALRLITFTCIALAVAISTVGTLWHTYSDDLEQCNALGGSYSGFGKCTRGQVVVFDLNHPLDETPR